MLPPWLNVFSRVKNRVSSLRPTSEVDLIHTSPVRLVGVGHSHLHALQDACVRREQSQPSAYRTARFLHMLAPEYNPTVQPDGSLNVDLKTAIEAALQDETPPLFFDCVSGNEYHFVGLVNHPRPYDFVLPSRPDLPLQPDAEIIPAGLMRSVLEAQAVHAIACFKALRAAIDVPIWHVQSPPPLPSDDYIRQNPGHAFAAQAAKYGVVKAPLRMKLWLLQSEIYREQCDQLGIGYVPTPDSACDADGFLLEEGWSSEPTHANIWYGAQVVQQLDVISLSMRESGAS